MIFVKGRFTVVTSASLTDTLRTGNRCKQIALPRSSHPDNKKWGAKDAIVMMVMITPRRHVTKGCT